MVECKDIEKFIKLEEKKNLEQKELKELYDSAAELYNNARDICDKLAFFLFV